MLLYNWCGYPLLNAYLQSRSTKQIQVRLDDNNYDDSELISVKVPAGHLSYYNSSNQFVRVDGQLEINGMQYIFVKRRLFNDSIEMLCIPNQAATHLNKAKSDYFKLLNDVQRRGQDKKSDSHSNKNFAGGDYCIVNGLFHINNLLFPSVNTSCCYSEKLPVYSAFRDERPPQKIA